MKKSLIILLILVITAVAGAGWAAADVNKAKDQIEIEEVALVGDRSMAEGLTVRARNTYDHHLFWDTVYTMEKDSAKAESFRTRGQAILREAEEIAARIAAHTEKIIGA